MEHTDIRMARETVQIVALQRFAWYRAEFEFINDGNEQTVELGFPFPVSDEHVDFMTYTALPPAAFRAWDGDEALDVSYVEKRDVVEDEDGNDYRIETTGYWVHETVFEPGSNRITVEYLGSPSGDSGWFDVEPPARWEGSMGHTGYYPYQFSSGEAWAGDISRAVLRFAVPDDWHGFGVEEILAFRAPHLEPTESEREGELPALTVTRPDDQTFLWVYEDFEPSERSGHDLSVPFLEPRSWAEGDGVWTPVSPAVDTSSSSLLLGDYYYPARQAIDGSPRSAWAEGVEGPGAGEFFDVSFSRPKDVTHVVVVPGYAKTEALFRKYNRPRTLTVEFDTGVTETLQLEDEPVPQQFAVSAPGATSARVTLGEAYRGTARDETYLTEVQFAEAPMPRFATFENLIEAEPGEPIDLTPPELLEPVGEEEEPELVLETKRALEQSSTESSVTADTSSGTGAGGDWGGIVVALLGGLGVGATGTWLMLKGRAAGV